MLMIDYPGAFRERHEKAYWRSQGVRQVDPVGSPFQGHPQGRPNKSKIAHLLLPTRRCERQHGRFNPRMGLVHKSPGSVGMHAEKSNGPALFRQYPGAVFQRWICPWIGIRQKEYSSASVHVRSKHQLPEYGLRNCLTHHCPRFRRARSLASPPHIRFSASTQTPFLRVKYPPEDFDARKGGVSPGRPRW